MRHRSRVESCDGTRIARIPTDEIIRENPRKSVSSASYLYFFWKNCKGFILDFKSILSGLPWAQVTVQYPLMLSSAPHRVPSSVMILPDILPSSILNSMTPGSDNLGAVGLPGQRSSKSLLSITGLWI